MNTFSKRYWFIFSFLILIFCPAESFASGAWGLSGVHFGSERPDQNRKLHDDFLIFNHKNILRALRHDLVAQEKSRFEMIDELIKENKIREARKWLTYFQEDLYFLLINEPWKYGHLKPELAGINFRLILLEGVNQTSDQLMEILKLADQVKKIETVEIEIPEKGVPLRDDVIYMKKLARAHRGESSGQLVFDGKDSSRAIEWNYFQARRYESDSPAQAKTMYEAILERSGDHYLKDDAQARIAHLYVQQNKWDTAWKAYQSLFDQFPFTEHYHSFLGTVAKNLDGFSTIDPKTTRFMNLLVKSYLSTFEFRDELEESVWFQKIQSLKIRPLKYDTDVQNFWDGYESVPESLKSMLLFLHTDKDRAYFYDFRVKKSDQFMFRKAFDSRAFFPFIDRVVDHVGNDTDKLNLIKKYPASKFSSEYFSYLHRKFPNEFTKPNDYFIRILMAGKRGNLNIYFKKLSDIEQKKLQQKLVDFGLSKAWASNYYREHTRTATSLKILKEQTAYIEEEWTARHFMHVLHHLERGFRSIQNHEYRKNFENLKGPEVGLGFGRSIGWTGLTLEDKFTSKKEKATFLEQFVEQHTNILDNPDMQLIVAYLKLYQNKPAEALRMLNLMEYENFSHKMKEPYFHAKGRAHYLLGNDNKAIKAFEKVEKSSYRSPKMRKKIKVLLGSLYEETGQYEKALKIYHDLDYMSDLAYLLDVELGIDQLREMDGIFQSDEINQKVRHTLAMKLMRNNKLNEAKKILRQLGNTEKITQVDTILRYRRQFKDASSKKKKAKTKYNHATYVYKTIRLYYNSAVWGDWGRSWTLRYLRLLPIPPEQSKLLGYMYKHNVKMRARKLYGEIVEQFPDIQPESPKSLFMQSLADLYIGTFGVWMGGTKYSAPYRYYRDEKGRARRRLDPYFIPRARKTFLKLEERYPGSYLADDALYWASFFTRDREEAEQMFNRLVQEYPNGDLTKKYQKSESMPRWRPYKRRD